MGTYLIIFLIAVAFVTFRISSRAYMAYTQGFKTWPILALLAAVYIVFAVIRFFTFNANPIFWIISLIVIFASQAIYASSRNS